MRREDIPCSFFGFSPALLECEPCAYTCSDYPTKHVPGHALLSMGSQWNLYHGIGEQFSLLVDGGRKVYAGQMRVSLNIPVFQVLREAGWCYRDDEVCMKLRNPPVMSMAVGAGVGGGAQLRD